MIYYIQSLIILKLIPLKHYIKKESPNTYDDIYRVINRTINTKITAENLTNYLKHSYKIYK